MYTLIRFSPFPPGGFHYVQNEGVYRKFKSGGSIEEQAHRVSAFRSANNLPRSGYAEALEDIDCQTCARLNNDREYCRDLNGDYASTHPAVMQLAACATCGTAKA